MTTHLNGENERQRHHALLPARQRLEHVHLAVPTERHLDRHAHVLCTTPYNGQDPRIFDFSENYSNISTLST